MRNTGGLKGIPWDSYNMNPEKDSTPSRMCTKQVWLLTTDHLGRIEISKTKWSIWRTKVILAGILSFNILTIHLCKKHYEVNSQIMGTTVWWRGLLCGLFVLEPLKHAWPMVFGGRPPQRSPLPSLRSPPAIPWILPPHQRLDISSWHRPRHVAKAWNRVTIVTRFLWNSYQRTSFSYHQQMYLKHHKKKHQVVGLMCWLRSDSRLQGDLICLQFMFPN